MKETKDTTRIPISIIYPVKPMLIRKPCVSCMKSYMASSLVIVSFGDESCLLCGKCLINMKKRIEEAYPGLIVPGGFDGVTQAIKKISKTEIDMK